MNTCTFCLLHPKYTGSIHISFDRANIWLWISGQSLFHSCYQKKPYMLSGSTAMQCKEFNSWKYIATMVCYRTNFRSWFPANIKFYRSCQGQHCSEFSAIRYWADRSNLGEPEEASLGKRQLNWDVTRQEPGAKDGKMKLCQGSERFHVMDSTPVNATWGSTGIGLCGSSIFFLRIGTSFMRVTKPLKSFKQRR